MNSNRHSRYAAFKKRRKYRNKLRRRFLAMCAHKQRYSMPQILRENGL